MSEIIMKTFLPSIDYSRIITTLCIISKSFNFKTDLGDFQQLPLRSQQASDEN